MARKNYDSTEVIAESATMYQDSNDPKEKATQFRSEGVRISFRAPMHGEFRLVIIGDRGGDKRRTLLCGLDEADLIAIRKDINAALAVGRKSK